MAKTEPHSESEGSIGMSSGAPSRDVGQFKEGFHSDDQRYQAVRHRDTRADGVFFYSVRTTGVYCRPSCAARLANRDNISFHATPEDAERAGFRPCKRCRPRETSQAQRHADAVTQACRLIDAADVAPALQELAAAVNLSAYHFHRIFKRVTGVTPKAYAVARRTQRVATQLATSKSVTDVIYDAGFNAPSRFYDSTKTHLGMTPTIYRAGGTGTEIKFAVGQCSLGAILVAATPKGVCAILLGDEPDALIRDLEDRFPQAALQGGDAAFEETVAQAVALVESPHRGFDLPLDIGGTAFQQRVWHALRQIPAGQTLSYADIAKAIGQPAAVRAVAQACAANALAVAIPCHRVVRSDGTLSGYRWGIDRKRSLLVREGAVPG
jgi:AraC family transcriptional regulator, regulatory protein of adaptative response / methylated-DNA-[protein]-cysteine methyltransferase